MTVSVALLVTAAVLCAVGGTLMLARPLTRVLLGVVVASNGVNLFLLSATGPAGEAALLYPGVRLRDVTDPLPQAITLTAIVITLGTTAFLLAMAYRSHQITGTDEVQDDVEDRRVALRAEVMRERPPRASEAEDADESAPSGEAPSDERLRSRAERRRLRIKLRAHLAVQARGRDTSGDWWHDVLGADPEDYAAERSEGAADEDITAGQERDDDDQGPGRDPGGRGHGPDRGPDSRHHDPGDQEQQPPRRGDTE
ncbi:Na(+)/H(+) antiporter subunit C [Streptomyces sp. NPDC005805]|uniref:Na(+)/H(+) antiporter subunit C n=1 Tax=Streptomyces sp. NPDC005805 TaxID=3157068 RepID=UPI0033CEC638